MVDFCGSNVGSNHARKHAPGYKKKKREKKKKKVCVGWVGGGGGRVLPGFKRFWFYLCWRNQRGWL